MIRRLTTALLSCALSTMAATRRTAAASRLRLTGVAGQGTVEYVALILLVAGVLAGVVAAAGDFSGHDIGQTIVDKLKDSIDGVGNAPGKG